MSETPQLAYILRVEESAKKSDVPVYGMYMLTKKGIDYFLTANKFTDLETLADSLKSLSVLFPQPIQDYSYIKRSDFPDIHYVPGQSLFTKFYDLTPEEISVFEKAFARAIANIKKKRHNPEITEEDLNGRN